MNLRLIAILLCCSVFSQMLTAQTYFLNGDASFLGDDCYLLTPAVNTQNGTVWYGDQLDLNEPFNIQFTMNFGTNDDNGADGIVFVLQTVGVNAIGESGGGIGYLGFDPSFGIEFDTWFNGDYADPFYDHIAMVSNGVVDHNAPSNIAGPVQASGGSINIEDGLDHVVQVIWNPESMTMSVSFDCLFRLVGNVDLVQDIFQGQNLVYWGFTSGTGGANNNHSVCLQENILVENLSFETCPGAGVEIGIAGDPNSEYLWSPAEFLDDPTSANPIASPESTTTYTVEYDDLCGNGVSEEVIVEVIEQVTNIAQAEQITCLNPNETITVESNFSQVDFNWTNDQGDEIDSGTNGDLTVNAGGTYFLSSSVNGACVDQDSIVVIQNTTAYELSLESTGDIDCNQSSSFLTSNTNGVDAEYNWTSGNGNFSDPSDGQTIEALSAGNYQLEITNPSNGCSTAETIGVNDLIDYPEIFAGIDDSISCQSPILTFEETFVDGNYDLQWNTNDGAIVNASNPLATMVSAPGTYVLTAVDPSNGCSSSDSLIVFLDGSLSIDADLIALPNVLTTNQDGLNEEFRPFLKNNPELSINELMSNVNLVVLNRWGNEVYSSDDASIWNGESKGDVLTDGVYFYVYNFDLSCGTTQRIEKNGTLQITSTK